MNKAPACPRCGSLAAYGEPHCEKKPCGWVVCGCRATYDLTRGTSYHPDDWKKS